MRQKPRSPGMNSIQAIRNADESAQAVQAAAILNTRGLHVFFRQAEVYSFWRI
jgi:hypothetical protein